MRSPSKIGVSTVMSKKCPADSQGSLVMTTSPGSSLFGEDAHEMRAGDGQRIDVAGRAGVGLRHHAAAPVEQRAGQIAGLAHDRAEGDALQRLGALGDDADQVGPEDFEFDAVHRLYPFRAKIQPILSTVAVQPGGITVVVSRSSMIAGPLMLWPAASVLRS